MSMDSNNNSNLEDICNFNIKNMPTDDLYSAFNTFIFNQDIKVLGKLLHRYNFFNLTKNLPGDIVELGVFKGSGVATFIKFLEIFVTHSNKKVIGFDIFNKNNNIIDNYKNGNTMKTVYNKVNDDNELSLLNVKSRLQNINKDLSKFILVEGDVCSTTKEFALNNPGFRISLLYVDLDLNEPVYHSLMNLWDRVLPGGYIVFDEYEYHKFDESCGVDAFLKDKSIKYEILSTNWIAPTAYLIKKIDG